VGKLKEQWGRLEQRFLPAYTWQANLLTFWRERILFTICVVTAFLGPLALVPSLILSYAENRWDIIALDTGAYVAVVFVLVSRGLSLTIRAGVVCLVFYILGGGLLMMLGPIGAGYIWLFGASVMAACIIGFRAAMVALVLNLLVLLGLAVHIQVGRPAWALIIPNMLEVWLVMTANFMLLNGLVSVTAAVMLSGLMDALAKEQEAGVSLRRSEERFRLIVENLPILIVGYDQEGRWALWNRECERVTGYASAEIVGLHGSSQTSVPAPGSPGITQDQLLPGLFFRDQEKELTCKDGQKRTVAWTNVSDLVEVPGLKNWAVGIDVTERKKAEQEVLASKEKYRLIFDNAIEGIAVIQDGRVCFVNQRALEMAGRQEANGDSFMDWVHPEDRGPMEAELLKISKGEALKATYSLRLGKSDEGLLWVDVSPVLMMWEGRPATLVFVTDVSGRIQAEVEQARLEAQLQQARKMEAVGTLAGGIAHDFNNLLQVINGYAQMLIMDVGDDDRARDNLEEISAAGARAAELVRQLLLFGRKVEAKRQPVDLNAEVEKARKILERTIPKMIDIEGRYGSRVWPVMADPVQIEQILLNFGTNAVDAMPDGGRLIIETENVGLAEEFHQGHAETAPGNYVLLSVSDTGKGMDKAVVEHIFEPFFTTKEIGKGTGLGLASVYGIVKSHGGYISCYSEPGQGTTFKIYLPALDTLETAEGRAEAPVPTRGGDETILVVDDDPAVRHMATRMLNRSGYTVVTASTGEEALEIYASDGNGINLVVLDIGMPGMGGHKCLRELLKIAPEAKVIIASGYSANGQLKETLAAGAAGYVPKPYESKDLLNTVRRVLDAHS
jgi:PAS domain S-box-containing protein